MTSYLTVPAIAELYGISQEKVLGWIHAGELRGVNVAARGGSRPRWRVSRENLETFEAARSSGSPPRRKPRQPRKPQSADLIQII
jgi:excisionase family DNA binding protein